MANHTKAIKAQQTALHDLVNAYATADRELKKLELQNGLYPHEREAAEKSIRDRMAGQVRQANLDLQAAQAQARKLAEYAPSDPDPNAMYYATEAARALDGVDAPTASTIIQKVVDTGNKARAQEYVATARKIFEHCDDMGMRTEYYGMRRDVEPPEARQAAGWGKACDRLEQRVALVRNLSEEGIANLVGKTEAGQLPGTPVNTAPLFALANNLENHAVEYVEGGDEE